MILSLFFFIINWLYFRRAS